MKKISSNLVENKKMKGFTLVELLVVVAIIAILSVIGLTIFSTAQANARDARRKSDVDAIAAALETKRAPGSIYYSTIAETDFSSGSIPRDTNTTVTQSYCVKVYSTDSGAQEANPTWASSSTAGCPATTATWQPATAADGFSATSFPANTEKSWKVCARLETNPTTIYCKPSSQ